MAIQTLEEVLASHRFLICVGTGGVGKTTIAAALALRGAQRGRRALVLTIDPARRLADALGTSELGNQPSELAPDQRAALALPEGGRLFAMMLDMKRTFDDLVGRFADSDETRERILQNRIYENVSDALAGSSEYAAMEKLYEIAETQDFDPIVLDTPPAQHALEFIDAPQRLLEFLDSRIVKSLLHPAFAAGRFGFRFLHGAIHRVFGLIERVAGVGFLEDISEFLLAFENMSEGFQSRARRVQERIFGEGTAFVLIASPSAGAAAGALALLDQLEASRAPLAGVIVNRMHLWPDGEDHEIPTDTGPALESLQRAFESAGEDPAEAEEAARAAIGAAKSYAGLVALDQGSTRALRERAQAQSLFFCRVSELPEDVHDTAGLRAVAEQLFGPQPRETS